MSSNGDPPRIFICFAGEDRLAAHRLAADLRASGVSSFIDATSIRPGENIVLAIDKAVTQSDYFVLLWSRHTDNRPWVAVEWTAALTRDLNERRSFLFVVRLDDWPLPALLAPRKYLDAVGRWEETVIALTTVWNRDRSMGLPVLPAPNRQLRNDGPPIMLYVRNQRIPVAHVVPVSPTATGTQLRHRVSEALQLPENVSSPDELVTTRITYELEFAGHPIADRPLAQQGVRDQTAIDLAVTVEVVANGREVLTAWTYRQESRATVDEQTLAKLVDAAFDHLRPWQREPRRNRTNDGVPGW